MQQRYHITIFKIWQEKFETLRTFLIPFLAIPAATFSLTSFHAHTAITQKHKPEPNRFGSGFPLYLIIRGWRCKGFQLRHKLLGQRTQGNLFFLDVSQGSFDPPYPAELSLVFCCLGFLIRVLYKHSIHSGVCFLIIITFKQQILLFDCKAYVRLWSVHCFLPCAYEIFLYA